MVLLAVGLLAFFLILGLTGGGDQPGSGQTTDRASDESAQDRQAQERARRRRERAQPQPRRVTLRVVPAEATYVCIDNGRGRTLFEGTIDGPRTWRGRRLRINLGKQSATIRVNGRRVPLDAGPNPIGFDFTPSGRDELPIGDRPCA